MAKKKLPTIKDLLEQPEQTIKDKSSSVIKTFGQGSVTSGLIFLVMWCLTSDISFNEALKMIISGSITLIGACFFILAKYMLKRINNNEKIMVIIAEKHKIAQESSAFWENKYRIVADENRELREAISTQLKEVNRIILEFICERQKGFEQERILHEVKEAIDNANRGCK